MSYSTDIFSPTLKRHMQTYLHATATGFQDNLPAFGPNDNIPLAFNVSFMVNARPLCLMEVASSTIANSLITEDHSKTLARQWIFPNPEDLKDVSPSILNNGIIKESQWLDGGLNAEQRVGFGFLFILKFHPTLNDVLLLSDGCYYYCSLPVACTASD